MGQPNRTTVNDDFEIPMPESLKICDTPSETKRNFRPCYTRELAIADDVNG